MNQQEITDAIVELALNPEKREEMGENGYSRVIVRHKVEDMRRAYKQIYRKFSDDRFLDWTEEPFHI